MHPQERRAGTDIGTISIAILEGKRDGKLYVRVFFPHQQDADIIGPFNSKAEVNAAYDDAIKRIRELYGDIFPEGSTIEDVIIQ